METKICDQENVITNVTDCMCIGSLYCKNAVSSRLPHIRRCKRTASEMLQNGRSEKTLPIHAKIEASLKSSKTDDPGIWLLQCVLFLPFLCVLFSSLQVLSIRLSLRSFRAHYATYRKGFTEPEAKSFELFAPSPTVTFS